MEGRERGGRGRIAQVLKDARASLKEPSRPHTPASLDARTAMSLDGAMSRAHRHDADRNGRGDSSRNAGGSRSRSSGNQQQPDIWVNENYHSNDNSEVDTDGYTSLGDSSVGNNQGRGSGSARNSSEFVYGLIAEDLRQSIGNGNGGGSRRNSAEAESISQNVFGMTPSSSADEMATVKGNDITSGKSNTLQLMICDLRDSISALDNELSVSRRSGSGDMGASGEQSLVSILSGMTQPVDRLAKHIKSGAKVAPGLQKDLDGVLQSVKRTLMRVVNDVNGSSASERGLPLPDTSRLACRHLLKVYLSLLAQVATSALGADVARVIMRTSKALYLIDASSSSHGTNSRRGGEGGKDGAVSEDAGDEASASRQQRGRPGSSSSSGSGSSRRGSGVGEEQMLQGGGDLLLELLQQTWTRLPSDLYRELQAQAQASGGGSNRETGSKQVAAEDDDDGLPSHLDNPMFLLLEGAVYAAGIVRCYSSSAVNTKRLVHLGAVETAVTGMRVTASSIDVIDKARRKKAAEGGGGGGGGGGGAAVPSSSSPNLISLVISQLARAMEQTTATLRAFTLEKQGRAKLLEQGAVALLCRLTAPSFSPQEQGAYCPSPELVLNCVRATAKLSLLEPFRAQLNQKQANLRYISALILHEDEQARSSSSSSSRGGGGGGGVGVGASPWPQWHTWPLLSRVCFTLANLTTSNDANRHTIALVNGTMQPLLCLLGCCGLRLRRFAQERRRRRAELLLLEQSLSFDSDPGLGPSLGSSRDKEEAASPFAEAEVEDGDSQGTGGGGGNSSTADSASAQAAELEVSDAAVKMLRLVANLAIEAKVGAAVACDLTALNVVVALLADHAQQQQGTGAGAADEDSVGAPAAASGPGSGSGPADLASEELLLNAVAACTNISYYACIQTDRYAGMVLSAAEELAVCGGEEDDEYVLCPSPEEHLAEYTALAGIGNSSSSSASGSAGGEAGVVTMERLPLVYLCRLASHLASCLYHVNDEVVLEAARALGNLTRLPHVLRGMTRSRTDEALVLLLGHRSMEVVAAVAGTLVNLSAHAEARHNLLRRTPAMDSLTHALRRSSLRHITTSMLLCQVFHNLYSTTTTTDSASAEWEQEEEGPPGQGQGDCEGLLDTLDELVDLASEVEEADSDKYAVFARIGGAVRGLLLERCFENDNEGPSPQRRERGV